jgi:predicted TIM-barrel fold metal-dependent hydrolase
LGIEITSVYFKRFKVIVDTHTHTPQYKDKIPESEIKYITEYRPDKAVKVPKNWAEYIADRKPVDISIVFSVAMHPGDRPNEQTAEFVRAYPDMLIGFLSVHPDDPSCLEEIDHSVHDFGLRGIKLLPSYQNFDPLGESAIKVYKKADQMGLPILFHAGITVEQNIPSEWGHPRYFDQIAIAFPNLKMILAHMAETVDTQTLAAILLKHANVYSDVSSLFYRPWSFYNCMRTAEEWGVMDKLLFATDYPVGTPQETIDALRKINDILKGTNLPHVSENAIEGVIHRDSLSLLGLV